MSGENEEAKNAPGQGRQVFAVFALSLLALAPWLLFAYFFLELKDALSEDIPRLMVLGMVLWPSLFIILLVAFAYTRSAKSRGSLAKPRLASATIWLGMIGVLLGFGFSYFVVSRASPRLNPCASNLRQIGFAIKQYAQDNDGELPPYFDALYPIYVDSPKIFSCPRKPSKWQEIQRTGKVKPEYTSYVYVSGLNDADPSGCILLYCRFGNHTQAFTHVTFLDTHTEWMSLEEFKGFLDETRRFAHKKGREVKLIGE